MPDCSIINKGVELELLLFVSHTIYSEARMAKDDVATDSDGRAERDGAVVG